MKEKILQELKTRAAKSGCSERTIETYVNNIVLPEDEAALTEEYYTAQVNILKSLGGQMSADIARQVDEFKKNYKPQPVPPTPTPPTPPTPPALPPEFEQFQKEVREFMQSRKAEEDRAKREGILSQVRKNLIEQGATDEFVLDYVFMSKANGINFEKSADDITKAMKEEYDTQFSRAHHDTGSPYSQNGGGSGAATLSAEQKAEVVKGNHEKYCQSFKC